MDWAILSGFGRLEALFKMGEEGRAIRLVKTLPYKSLLGAGV